MHASHSLHLPELSGRPHSLVWSRTEALSLLLHGEGSTISMCLPTHHPSELSHQDPIRLNNLLRRLDASNPEIMALGEAIQDVVETIDVLRHPTEGLAIFADKRGVRCYRAAHPLPEMIVVAPRPHILPLMPLLQDDGRFYLLELHQHGIRLHEGTRDTLTEIIISGFSGTAPTHQHRHVDRSESGRTVHPSPDLPHIHIGSVHEQDAKERAAKYFRALTAALEPILTGSTAPLLLSGVPWLQPLYAEVNHYQHLLTEGIPNDTTALGTMELHALAWPFIAPHYIRHQQEAIERHAQAQHLGLITHSMHEVLTRLMERRVSSLLIASDLHPMGTIDERSLTIEEHVSAQPGDEDLANVAAVLAYKQPIPLWLVDRALIPGRHGISACLSY